MMSIITDVNTIATEDLYWENEKVRDIAFKIEYQYNKAKTKRARKKWWEELLKILDIQKKFERRIHDVFGA